MTTKQRKNTGKFTSCSESLKLVQVCEIEEPRDLYDNLCLTIMSIVYGNSVTTGNDV